MRQPYAYRVGLLSQRGLAIMLRNQAGQSLDWDWDWDWQASPWIGIAVSFGVGQTKQALIRHSQYLD